MDKTVILGEIKGFLEGYNTDLKYLVNVETDQRNNIAECIIHEPNQKPRIENIIYEPFMYMKDLSKLNYSLYKGKTDDYIQSKREKYGITITKLKTGNQKRLADGYCYKITSSKSYNDILNYLSDGGINPREKLKDLQDNYVKNKRDESIYIYRDCFYSLKTTEQFFISNKCRLYKGFEEYKNIHKLTFDIETTGLRYQVARVFAIGVRDNKGFETILEVEKVNDDESEIKLIRSFFELIDMLKPAIISGQNSEMFDFEFILGRAKLLKMNLYEIPTGLKKGVHLKRRPNASVKYGNTPDKYTATEMWGYSIIDILHAIKKTAAVNSDLKENKLKYVAKYEKIARPNRTYIDGEDNNIGRFYAENKIFLIDEINNYIIVPNEFQEISKKLYELQNNKNNISDIEYKEIRTKYLNENIEFINWFRIEALPKKLIKFIEGKNLVKQYLLDDLWETEQVDELYNQSSFMLAKIVPTTYQRVCTMGTAGIWNILMTAWSYENDLAIPCPDKYEKYSGGLARCYKLGYSKRIIKIDYGSLYPMIQLTEGVFPIFDITGVMKKMLLYLSTTRNIYKKLANKSKLNDEEIKLFEQIDSEAYIKYINNTLTNADFAMFKIKQLPIKILNNSQYGAFGSNVSFNWSDNVCAARITCTARLHLRHAISWFSNYGCVALLAVTDGINFQYPEKTTIRITNEGTIEGTIEGIIEEMWQYGDKVGISALVEKYNKEEMKPPFMSVDEDGKFISCLNLSRINYATLSLVKDKKTGEMKEKIKLTGNTIKSKIMPEYIEDFIDKGFELILHGKGEEFVEYYYKYANDIRNMKIPLKKIASKCRIKITLDAYNKRGCDKNGREKGKQAHMELLIEKRNKFKEQLIEKYITDKTISKEEQEKLIINYMPPEPELDSTVYYVNTGYQTSHGASNKITDKNTGDVRYASTLIKNEDLFENPNMLGEYNYNKYLNAFTKRVKTILVGFEPEVAKTIPVKIPKEKKLKKGEVKIEIDPNVEIILPRGYFTKDQLKLKNHNLDDFDESMHLEKMEVDFWNKTGYDPRLIWNGFKMYEDNRVHYEIYDNALNYLNQLMIVNNKPNIKSINDDRNNGDLILIKEGGNYHVGLFNGVYIQIIRSNVEIPKSKIELELDKKLEEEQKRVEIKESEITEIEKSKIDQYLKEQNRKKEFYFKKFKKNYEIPNELSMNDMFAMIENSDIAFEDYVVEQEKERENEAIGYIGVDEED